MNPTELTALIESRRSIFPKKYTGEIIDDSLIHQILSNGNWAPTHKYTEPWRFVVFCGEGLKKFAEFQSSRYIEKYQNTNKYSEQKLQKLKNQPLKCSHIISVGMRRDPEERVDEMEEIAAVSCAVQNMMLTATSYGLGNYWSTGGVTYDEGAKEFFGLGMSDRLMGFLYLGIHENEIREGKRGPIEEKVEWIRD